MLYNLFAEHTVERSSHILYIDYKDLRAFGASSLNEIRITCIDHIDLYISCIVYLGYIPCNEY